jgi:ribonuclease HI
MDMSERTEIWTDGGTKSNIPPFGIGYGSFRIGENGKNVSINFNIQMSCNAAEIFTMVHALNRCESNFITVYSDSRNALRWLKDSPFGNLEVKDSYSSGMKDSIVELRKAAKGKNIKAKWRPRAQIFKIFGH